MAEKVNFELNVPAEVSLRFNEGKLVEGRYGDQYLYSLDDGRIMYLDPAVSAQINKLDVRKGERFTICKKEVKNGRQRSIEWQVARLVAEPAAEAKKAQPVQEATPSAIQPKPNESTTPTTSPQPTTDRAPITIGSKLMAGALIASIDAHLLAADYARSKGLSVTLDLDFNAEDVRTCANAILIQYFKEAELNWKQRSAELRGEARTWNQ